MISIDISSNNNDRNKNKPIWKQEFPASFPFSPLSSRPFVQISAKKGWVVIYSIESEPNAADHTHHPCESIPSTAMKDKTDDAIEMYFQGTARAELNIYSKRERVT